eukprot:COSAG05_NODE_215_length_13904_cov_87.085911_11_plen_155_part_00
MIVSGGSVPQPLLTQAMIPALLVLALLSDAVGSAAAAAAEHAEGYTRAEHLAPPATETDLGPARSTTYVYAGPVSCNALLEFERTWLREHSADKEAGASTASGGCYAIVTNNATAVAATTIIEAQMRGGGRCQQPGLRVSAARKPHLHHPRGPG